MSIFYPCPSCKSVFSIQKNKCKCGKPASDINSFRIILKYGKRRVQRDVPRDLGGLSKAREVERRLYAELYEKKLNRINKADEITLAAHSNYGSKTINFARIRTITTTAPKGSAAGSILTLRTANWLR